MSRPVIPERSESGDSFSMAHGRDIVITVDGEQASHALSYDIPKGEVVCLKRKNGGFDYDRKAGIVRTVTLTGKVAVHWKRKPPGTGR